MSKSYAAGAAIIGGALVLSACGGGGPSASGGEFTDDKVVIAVLNDQSGVYKDLSGPNSVKAVEMAIADSDKSEQVVRMKVDHASGIVFPISAKGKKASAEGVLEKIASNDKEANEAASEHAGHSKVSDFAKKYHVKATGAVVK